mmetsp:Transcript_69889/g.188901  ORF Transcript_69889/g.188901 Transcript_69889/m.188901 type:complete len:360 (+) Transcript_69889:522-1601(+)
MATEPHGRHHDHDLAMREHGLAQEARLVVRDNDDSKIIPRVLVVLLHHPRLREPLARTRAVGHDGDVHELEADLHVHGGRVRGIEAHLFPGRLAAESLVGPPVLLPHVLLGDCSVGVRLLAHHVPRRDLQPVSLGNLGQVMAALGPPSGTLPGTPASVRLRVRDVVGPLVRQPDVTVGLVDFDASRAAEAGHVEAAPGASQGAGAAGRREPQARQRCLVAARVIRIGDHLAKKRRERVLHVLVERRPDLVAGEVQAPTLAQRGGMRVRHDKLQDVPRVAHGLRSAQQLPHPAVNLPVLLEFVSVLEVAVPLVHGSLLRTTMFSLIRCLNAGVNLGLLVRRVQLPHGQRVGQTGPQPEQR